MASTSSGYGLVPVRKVGATSNNHGQESFLIDPAGVAQNIGYGSVVSITAAGYLQLAPGTGADATTNNFGGSSVGAIGIFVGCEYVNSEGQLIFGQYYPSGTLNATAYVVTDPSVVFQVQANGALAQTNLGQNIDFNAAQNATTSVNTTTGKSNMQVDAAAVGTATAGFKIVGFSDRPGSAIGDAYTDVLVKFNAAYHANASAPVSL